MISKEVTTKLFRRIGESLYNLITSRLLLLFIMFAGMAVILIYRLFDLQIVNGESYLDNFRLMIQKKKLLRVPEAIFMTERGIFWHIMNLRILLP